MTHIDKARAKALGKVAVLMGGDSAERAVSLMSVRWAGNSGTAASDKRPFIKASSRAASSTNSV